MVLPFNIKLAGFLGVFCPGGVVGKPYLSELQEIPSTMRWASLQPIDALSRSIQGGFDLPLLAIGSGGSFATAVFACFLHARYAGEVAHASTPYKAAGYLSKRAFALLISAGGRNPDVLGIFKRMVRSEPEAVAVLCCTRKSKLSELCARYEMAEFFGFELPSGGDGFVATNSLMATAVLLWRAYTGAFEQSGIEALIGEVESGSLEKQLIEDLTRFSKFAGRPYFILLHGKETEAAAVDIESKFSEVGLGSIQLCDFRNFAHGRHNWLDKLGLQTGIVSLESMDDFALADRTLQLLPDRIPRIRLQIPFRGVAAAVASLVAGMHLVSVAGTVRGIDPGRPGVPDYGSRLYRLNGWPRLGPESVDLTASQRKSGKAQEVLIASGEIEHWRSGLRRFMSGLFRSRFKSIILDYDGTLCSSAERLLGPRPDVLKQLERFCDAGVTVGIATGRGKSVRNDLQRHLPARLWGKIIVAYHNGAEVGLLKDKLTPAESKTTSKELAAAADMLLRNEQLNRIGTVNVGARQITVEPKQESESRLMMELVQQLLAPLLRKGILVVFSTRSVDVLSPGISKLALRQQLPEGDVISIGDLGAWPGNDFELLSSPHSLSVNRTSHDIHASWNIAPPGYRGVQATLHYLSLLRTGKGFAYFPPGAFENKHE